MFLTGFRYCNKPVSQPLPDLWTNNSHNSLDCTAIDKNSELLYVSGSCQVGKNWAESCVVLYFGLAWHDENHCGLFN